MAVQKPRHCGTCAWGIVTYRWSLPAAAGYQKPLTSVKELLAAAHILWKDVCINLAGSNLHVRGSAASTISMHHAKGALGLCRSGTSVSAIPSARLRSAFTGGTAATAVGATVSLISRTSSSHMAAGTSGTLMYGTQGGPLVGSDALFEFKSHAGSHIRVRKRVAQFGGVPGVAGARAMPRP